MNKLVGKLLLVAALLFTTSIFSHNNFKLLTFNIWDPNDVPFWEAVDGFPVDKVFKYITEDGADVLLLQEVSLENGQKKQAYHQLKLKLEKASYLYSAY